MADFGRGLRMTDVRSMFDRIASELAAGSSDHFPGLGPAKVGDITVIANPYSNTARITLEFDGDERNVYVKVPVADDHNRNLIHGRLRDEYQWLRRLTRTLPADTGLGVVEPVAYLPDWPALVTREAPGPTLQQLLGRYTRRLAGRNRVESLEQHCLLAGRWLAAFQHITAGPRADFNLQPVVEYCTVRLEQLREHPKPMVDEWFRRSFLQRLQSLASRLPPGSCLVAACHNDFAPHNLIANPGGIHVLDFSMCASAETCYDLVNFWERLETLKVDPLRSPVVVERLQRAFVAGYGGEIDMDRPDIRIARCKFRLTQMASLAGRTSGWSPAARQKRKLLDGYRCWLTSQIENAGGEH